MNEVLRPREYGALLAACAEYEDISADETDRIFEWARRARLDAALLKLVLEGKMLLSHDGTDLRVRRRDVPENWVERVDYATKLLLESPSSEVAD